MIEINLVPDVKQELINAQRIRTTVITLSIFAGIAALGIVIILALWVVLVQGGRDSYYNSAITSEHAKLVKVDDISNTLTVQHQLNTLSLMHKDKTIDSRIFDVLTTINPPAPNTIEITTSSLDAESKTIKIEAQVKSGFPGLEVFKKTIAATKFEYVSEGVKQSVPLAAQINHSDVSYGEDDDGQRVLRFTVSFAYPDELFSRNVESTVLVGPTRTNATDSFVGIPNSLFAPKASDPKEGN